MASRKIEDLVPELQEKYKLFQQKMDENNIKFIVTYTLRTLSEQTALYAQGRQGLTAVNTLRKSAGLPNITDKENKHTVTNTMKSKHLEGKAFDICILDENNKADWNNITLFKKASELGKEVGLKVGADFKSKDYPHYEV